MVAGPAVLAMDDAPDDVVAALSTDPPVRLLNPDAVDPVVAFLVPFAFAFIFFLTSQTFGLQIAQSVIEEKQTRIVEILVAAVPVRALLAGKVIAGTILAFGQIALIAVVAVAGMRGSATTARCCPCSAPAIGWFVPFFLLGFVLLAAMWAAAGALVNRQEDIGGVSMPVQLAVMLPFFAVIFLNDNATAMRVLSYLPFSVADGDAAAAVHTATPPAGSRSSLVSWSPTAALIAGARVYEGSLLRTNGRMPLLTAWREREPVG